MAGTNLSAGADAVAPTRARRQVGGDRRQEPLPPVSPPAPDRTIAVGRFAVFITMAAWVAFIATTIAQQFRSGAASSLRFKYEAVLYMVVVTLLTVSALSYLTARLGYYIRIRDHRRVPRAAVDEFLSETDDTLTVLVPSYQEDHRTIRTTLLSAALQEFPSLEVVLLIDDPPRPATAKGRRLLAQARALPREIAELLAAPAAEITELLAQRNAPSNDGTADSSGGDLAIVAGAYLAAVGWLEQLASQQPIIDHVDTFFTRHVIGSLIADLGATASALEQAVAQGASVPRRRADQLAERLRNIFGVTMSSFERKAFESLSHEPNKAMNLNSYLGLMGGSYCDIETSAGRILEPCDEAEADLVVRDPDFVLTLDADSVLLPEYCARLVYLLNLEGNQDVAIAQTPYSAYPGAATRLERIAGASTDLQHIVHQGLTHHNATFWVGANAVLRKAALDDIDTTSRKGNWQIHRYIGDRTVIEDTESTITLGTKGWRLYNYPERLSSSATPPDCGSLTIQRRRWADGGLLIAPRLMRAARRKDEHGQRPAAGEVFLRLNYMASIAWGTICLLFLLAYPFNYQLLSPIVVVVALPYFAMMAVDLHNTGYKRTDVFRVYGFNLILIPVNLAGVGNSLQQAITGEKVPFKRTPKISHRTPTPLLFVLAPYLLVGLALFTIWHDTTHSLWVNFGFAVFNVVLAIYAIIAFMGLGASLIDIWIGIVAKLYKVPKATPVSTAERRGSAVGETAPSSSWEAVLHYGVNDPALDDAVANSDVRTRPRDSSSS